MSTAAFVERASKALPTGDEPFWLSTYRANALERFSVLGLPKRKQEGWQFTDLRPLTDAAPQAPSPEAIDEAVIAGYALPVAAYRLVFVNGKFQDRLSAIGGLPAGVVLGPLHAADAELVRQAFDMTDLQGAQAFASLNAAAFTDGFALSLAADTILDHPVEVIHVVDDAAMAQTRNLVLLAPGASATLIETYIGKGAGWTNAVTRVDLGEKAKLRHVKVEDEAKTAIHISMVRAKVAAEADYSAFIATLGGRLSRQDLQITLAGENAHTGIHGLYLLDGDQEATLAPFVDHAAPNCTTNEVLKGVLDGKSHGVFLGTVMVREGADGTDAHQLNRNLLLSTEARVDTKPELTIYADDVKCSHGATVGDLDDASLFYLMARGIEPVKARRMLIGAFVQDVIDGGGLETTIADYVSRQIRKQLGGEGAE